jgi:hypothetical protein
MVRGLLRLGGGRHYRGGHVLLQEKRYELSRVGCGDPLFFETECWDDGSGRYGGSDIQSAVIFCYVQLKRVVLRRRLPSLSLSSSTWLLK